MGALLTAFGKWHHKRGGAGVACVCNVSCHVGPEHVPFCSESGGGSLVCCMKEGHYSVPEHVRYHNSVSHVDDALVLCQQVPYSPVRLDAGQEFRFGTWESFVDVESQLCQASVLVSGHHYVCGRDWWV